MMVLFIALAAAAPGGLVTDYLRPNLQLHDDAGKTVGTSPKGDLPKTPAPIKEVNALGEPGIEMQGRIVFLRNAEVMTRNFSGVCATLAAPAKASGSSLAMTDVGTGSKLSTTGGPCVPR